MGFSYGFRPGRNQHTALDAVTVALERKKVNWDLCVWVLGNRLQKRYLPLFSFGYRNYSLDRMGSNLDAVLNGGRIKF